MAQTGRKHYDSPPLPPPPNNELIYFNSRRVCMNFHIKLVLNMHQVVLR